MSIEKMLCIGIKLAFVREMTITATFDYKTESFNYIIKSSDFITGSCGYSLSQGKWNLSFYSKHIFS